jgi:hypothetical protein
MIVVSWKLAHPKFGGADGRIMKYVIGIAVIGAALFMAVPGGIILWMGLRSVWHGLTSSHWPTASGVVFYAGMTEDQAKQVDTKNTYNFYSTNLEFHYRVNGRWSNGHIGNRLFWGHG